MIKIKKRQSVFESNSSSMHSISIKNENDVYVTTKLKPGSTYSIQGGDYGWGYEVLNSWDEKLDYLVAEFQDNEKIDIIKNMFKEYTGCELDCSTPGGIDHQSMGLISDHYSIYRLSEEEVYSIFEDIVFNNSIEIIIDNDNH